MTWYNLLALLGLVVGFFGGWNSLRSLRKGRTDAVALLDWEQAPAPWHYEGTAYLVIGIHSISLALLAGLLLWVFNRAGDVPGIPGISAAHVPHYLYILVAIVPLVQAGIVVGTGLAFPLGNRLIRPVHYALAESGPCYGRARHSWSFYSHYAYDPETGVVRLFSAACPALPNSIMLPPRESALNVVEIVRRYLPAQPPAGLPWYRAPWALVAGMSLLALVFLLPGLWLVKVPAAWLYYFLAIWLLQDLGMRLIYYYDPSGKPKRQRQQEGSRS